MAHTEMHIRSQKSKGSCPGGWGGPDTYVAVTVTPDGTECPYALNLKVLAKRGITFYYMGEGYAEHRGPRSALGRAIAAAQAMVEAA